MVAQGSHASINAFMDCLTCHNSEIALGWQENLATKICVGVSSEQELCDIYDNAKNAGIPCALITDAGKTEFGGVPTKTAVAIGPYKVEEIDKITGKLTLL